MELYALLRYVGLHRMHCDKHLIALRSNTSTAVGPTSDSVCGLKMVVKRQEIFFVAMVRHSVQNSQQQECHTAHFCFAMSKIRDAPWRPSYRNASMEWYAFLRHVRFRRMYCDKLLTEFRINTSTAVCENSGWGCCVKMDVKRREIFFIAKVRHSVQNGQ